MKTYKIYFVSGKEITVGAGYVQYLHEFFIMIKMK